ncbi:MAG: hypothetical protein GXO50_01630 [Chlorobi bacterium]|nr:hypothetical protein [Chlorobiota bacterium]
MPEPYLTISDVTRIYNELKDVTSYDFTKYRFSFKMRRAQIFMQKNNINNVNDLIFKLNQSKTFALNFSDNLFVPQTELFRDTDTWNYLNQKLLPKLTSKSNPVIHIPYCVFGKELYSLIYFLGMFKSEHINIIVSVTDKKNIEIIKNGIFSVKDIKACEKNTEQLDGNLNIKRVFYPHNKNYKLRHSFKGRIIFEEFDFFKHPGISEFDMVLFRNRLIYYNEDMQKDILKITGNSVKKGGYLILGEREIKDVFSGRFKRIYSKSAIFKKRFI